MAWGRRCDAGCHSWPDSTEYEVCAQCGEKTKRFANLTPLSVAEAESVRSHIEFEDYYENIWPLVKDGKVMEASMS